MNAPAPRHVLTITPINDGSYEGHLLYEDGCERATFRSERAQILGWAQTCLEQRRKVAQRPPGVETLILDDDGLIVREPEEFSQRVA